ncbi:hypothetical protein GCM10011399_00300 [Subtercola lobariae]|uniref:BetI-type transcriptional repressor C-terminal domain-containing protein n=1 Tax=Subtercola lobariae TaxID=1588641 RepID=A0A917AYF5_9MICO|nr:hypothetical protein GCM10011399_00300 [Subtercola lobariae]
MAEVLGVVPGLINHYFNFVDDLVAAAFGYATTAERTEIYAGAFAAPTPSQQLLRLFTELLDTERDAVSLLWLDAWQASRRRPALLREVVIQMRADVTALAALIQSGIDVGDFTAIDPSASATRIMSLIDGLSVRAATRSFIDYEVVAELVLRNVERELDLPEHALSGTST